MHFSYFLILFGFIGLIFYNGFVNTIYFILIIILPISIFMALLSEGYFFGDIGRYLFLVIMIPIAIIYNNKKYKKYFKEKVSNIYKKFKDKK